MKTKPIRGWAASLATSARRHGALAAAIIMLAVLGVIAVAFADEPAPIIAYASVPSTEAFTYTGYLEWSGAPANGPFDFRFSLYTLEAGGGLVGSVEVVDDQPVENGVFTVYLTCGGAQLVFDGGPRWLQVEVRPGASLDAHTVLPRQPIAATPYAWTLRPWAHVVGDLPAGDLDGAILATRLSGAFPIGAALEGSTVATGTAVRGLSPSGWGVYGYSEASFAVYGFANGTGSATPRGYGGYFEASNGVGVYGRSSSSAHYGHGGWFASQWGNGVFATSAQNAAVRGEGGNVGAAGVSQPGGPSGVVGLSSTATGVWGSSNTGSGVRAYSNSGVGVVANSGSGNIIEAWSTSASNRRFYVDNAGEVWADGNFHSGGADFAELLPAAVGLDHGDVLAVGADGLLVRSCRPYQTSVLGVYSTEPGLVGGAIDGAAPEGTVPLAVVGVVPAKVSAENGAVAPGDLLVSSSSPGHAMRAGDYPPQGTVLGKALEAWDEGTGVIRILVTLQ